MHAAGWAAILTKLASNYCHFWHICTEITIDSYMVESLASCVLYALFKMCTLIIYFWANFQESRCLSITNITHTECNSFLHPPILILCSLSELCPPRKLLFLWSLNIIFPVIDHNLYIDHYFRPWSLFYCNWPHSCQVYFLQYEFENLLNMGYNKIDAHLTKGKEDGDWDLRLSSGIYDKVRG